MTKKTSLSVGLLGMVVGTTAALTLLTGCPMATGTGTRGCQGVTVELWNKEDSLVRIEEVYFAPASGGLAPNLGANLLEEPLLPGDAKVYLPTPHTAYGDYVYNIKGWHWEELPFPGYTRFYRSGNRGSFVSEGTYCAVPIVVPIVVKEGP